VGEEILPHLLQHFPQQRVAEPVEDLIAFLAGFHEVLIPQDGKVLGGVGLLDPDRLAQPAHRHLATAETLHDGDTGGMAKCLKDAGLELSH
jgi:hypothetical protein